jgi:hypothetical protein
MWKVTSAGPVLTGGVGDAEAIGMSIEFCAAAKVGSIKPPPAKALASRNRRRKNYCLRALSLFVDFPGEEIYIITGLRLDRSEISTANRTFLSEGEGLRLSIAKHDSESADCA